MHQINSSALSRTFVGGTRAVRLAVALSFFGLSGSALAQSATDTPVSPVRAEAVISSPAPAATPDASSPNATPRASSSMMLGQRAVGLTRAVTQDSTAPAPMLRRETTRTNTALMIVGAAAIILGAAVGEDAGTVLIIGGAGVGLYGLYRFLN